MAPDNALAPRTRLEIAQAGLEVALDDNARLMDVIRRLRAENDTLRAQLRNDTRAILARYEQENKDHA